MTQDVRSDAGGLIPGEQLAGYQIQEQIGRGGMAVVYRALDLRLGRVVALKVLAPHLGADDAFRQRFIRESRAAAGVDHPHIVPVYEAGEAGGVLFIAMRYVEHGDVRSLIDAEGPLSPSRAAAIAVQVASALDTAHRHGLVHRDVKPGNMLLARATNDADHVYLSDFGLSKQSLTQSTLTSAGQFLGTLDYVSPEQIQGHPVDGRADQYALACTVVEMLIGAPPFQRDDTMALMWAQLESEPPRLTQRRRDLPPEVDEVIAAALAKSPAARYPTCQDFALALRAACTGAARPVAARIPARWPQPQPPPQSLPPLQPPQPPLHSPPLPPQQSPPLLQPPPQSPGRLDDLLADRDQPIPRPAFRAMAGDTAHDLHQPGDSRREPTSGGSPGRKPPTGLMPGTRSALAVTRPSARRRRRSHRGRSLALAGVLALVCLAGAAGIGYALSHHHGAPPAAGGAAPPPPGPLNPAHVVREYFDAINHHRYLQAWRLDNQSEPLAVFRAGLARTAHDAVTISSVTGDVVSAQLIATQIDGTKQIYQGTYTVVGGVISKADIRRVS